MQLLEEDASEAALAETMLEGLGGALGMPGPQGRDRGGASLQVGAIVAHTLVTSDDQTCLRCILFLNM